MSMRINTNIEAFNAQRNLSNTATAYAKSVEKLSSGLRINRAGDDAAGLSISEKLKAQVNGLGQAQRNAQDGISLIQTAEGALNETHSILQRMRELTVQAANDTLADSDRGAIKSEMGQLTSEIDRIAKSTQFNGKNLLDGSLTATKSSSLTSASTGLGSMADTLADVNASTSFGSTAAAGSYAFTITNSGTRTSETGVTGTGAAQGATETFGTVGDAQVAGTLTIGSTGFVISAGETATTLAASINAASAGVTATVSNGHLVLTSSTAGATSLAASMPSISATGTILSDLGIGSGASGAQTAVTTATTNGIDAGTASAAGTFSIGSNNFTLSRGESVQSLAASINAANIGVSATVTGGKLVLSDSQHIGSSGTIGTISVSSQDAADMGLSFTGATGQDASGTVSFNNGTATAMTFTASTDSLSFGGASISLSSLGTSNVTGTIASNNSFTVNYQDKQANLQIGANAQQTLSVGIEDMGSKALGVDSLDVSNSSVINGNDGLGDGKNVDGTEGTLAKIDDAIAKVSNQRSTLGAYQNRLEHTISNLGVAQENLTASESRIVDVDMASEMVNFTKTGILQQAGQAILAQANQAPQGIMKLLG